MFFPCCFYNTIVVFQNIKYCPKSQLISDGCGSKIIIAGQSITLTVIGATWLEAIQNIISGESILKEGYDLFVASEQLHESSSAAIRGYCTVNISVDW